MDCQTRNCMFLGCSSSPFVDHVTLTISFSSFITLYIEMGNNEHTIFLDET